MGIKTGGFLAAVFPSPDAGKNTDDFRAVPASDRGNEGYADRGALGNYSPSAEPYSAPDGVRRFVGYGADEATLARGYASVSLSEAPAYDKSNYLQRWTVPARANEDMGETDVLENDFEFRGRNQRTRGFLTRPRVPTERG